VVVEARAGGAVVEVVGARVGGATEEVVGAGGGAGGGRGGSDADGGSGGGGSDGGGYDPSNGRKLLGHGDRRVSDGAAGMVFAAAALVWW
jgi:hypothetical protein